MSSSLIVSPTKIFLTMSLNASLEMPVSDLLMLHNTKPPFHCFCSAWSSYSWRRTTSDGSKFIFLRISSFSSGALQVEDLSLQNLNSVFQTPPSPSPSSVAYISLSVLLVCFFPWVIMFVRNRKESNLSTCARQEFSCSTGCRRSVNSWPTCTQYM